MDKIYYSQYKGIYYKYMPFLHPYNSGELSGVWDLCDREDGWGFRMVFSDYTRIDQAFERFFIQYEEFKKDHPDYNLYTLYNFKNGK